MTVPAASSPPAGDASVPRFDAGALDKDAQSAISFADLLASLQQAASLAADVQPEDLPSTEVQVRAQDEAQVEAQADATPPDPRSFLGIDQRSAAPDTRSQRAVAEIFNEHGLMQALDLALSQTAKAAVGASEAPQAAAAARQVPAPAARALASSAVLPQQIWAGPGLAAPVASDGLAHARPPWPENAGRVRVPRTVGGPGLAHRAGGLSLGVGVEAQAGGSAAQSARATRLRAAVAVLLHQAQASDAQLFFEIADQGVRIFARTGKLTREERVRLRSEIARLAAAHSLPAIEIRLNGEAGDQFALPGEES